jgi:hypothetical protein
MKQYVMIVMFIILIILIIGINSYTKEGFDEKSIQTVNEIQDVLSNSEPINKLLSTEALLKKYLQLLTNANQNYLTIEAKKTENPDFKMDISSCNLGEQVIHIDVPMGEQGIQGVQGPPGNQGPIGIMGDIGAHGYPGKVVYL